MISNRVARIYWISEEVCEEVAPHGRADPISHSRNDRGFVRVPLPDSDRLSKILIIFGWVIGILTKFMKR